MFPARRTRCRRRYRRKWSKTWLRLSSKSYYFIRPFGYTCGALIWTHHYQPWESHRGGVYMVICIQSARVMIRRINLITIIIILLSDKLAGSTNAPRGSALGKLQSVKMSNSEWKWFSSSDQAWMYTWGKDSEELKAQRNVSHVMPFVC